MTSKVIEEKNITNYIQGGYYKIAFQSALLWTIFGPAPLDVNLVYFAFHDKQKKLEHLFDCANNYCLVYQDFMFENPDNNLDDKKSETHQMSAQKFIQSLKDFSSEVKCLKEDLLIKTSGTQN
jgi:hypothetical protein